MNPTTNSIYFKWIEINLNECNHNEPLKSTGDSYSSSSSSSSSLFSGLRFPPAVLEGPCFFRVGFFKSARCFAFLISETSASRRSFPGRTCSTPEMRWRIAISVPQTSSGCSKLGVSSMSGIFWVRGSASMWRNAARPRQPLERKKRTRACHTPRTPRSTEATLTGQYFRVYLSWSYIRSWNHSNASRINTSIQSDRRIVSLCGSLAKDKPVIESRLLVRLGRLWK